MNDWKTTATGVGSALTSALTVVAALPYDLGDASVIIPPKYKEGITIAGIIATILLRVLNGVFAKDR